MNRFGLLFATLCCLGNAIAVASHPADAAVVASDSAVASSLSPLPEGTALAVLVQEEGEEYPSINMRALAMRHATHFVYVSGRETPLVAMYRQRLEAHGAISIDLQALPSQRSGKRPSSANGPAKLSLVNLLTKP